MKRSTILYLAIATISILFLSCNPADNKGTDNSNSQHQIPLGMRFENTNKLAGIPLASTPFGGDELPKMVDLSDKMPPVGNQGQQQSCVAWAIAYALKSYQEKVQTSQQMIFSPSYIYNQINNGMNAPTLVTDALNLLSEQGVCPMNDMPYNEQDWTSKPNEAAMQDARKFRIDFWRQVNTQDIKEVKAQLAAGYPVIIGADVSKDFIDGGFNEKANFVWKTSGQSQGGHCMLLTGYNDDQRAFRVMNSWGTTWGDNGFSWIDYTLFPQVVKYGFVAKDAINTNNNLVRNELNNNPQNNNTILPNNNTNPQNNTQPENPNNNTENFYKPTQDYSKFSNIDFKCNNVDYNVVNPGDPSLGNNMKVEGTVDIPPGLGQKFEIVIHIYSSATKQQVKSLIYPTYSDVNGFACSHTPIYDLKAEGFRNGTWWIDIPYNAIEMPRGTRTYFYAVPTLFVDNFGVSVGDKIEFYVDMP